MSTYLDLDDAAAQSDVAWAELLALRTEVAEMRSLAASRLEQMQADRAQALRWLDALRAIAEAPGCGPGKRIAAQALMTQNDELTGGPDTACKGVTHEHRNC